MDILFVLIIKHENNLSLVDLKYKKVKMSKSNKNTLQTPENYIKTKARNLPVYRCYINNDWEASKLANIFIFRKHTNQNVTCGIYLVDTACLGIKDSFYYFNVDEDEVSALLFNGVFEFISIDYNLAHNIIYGALAFADDYGFIPAKEWKITQYILEEDDDKIPLIELDFGENGIPVYYAGPNDNENSIKSVTNTLKRTAGEGNYKVIVDDESDFLDDLHDQLSPFETGELEKIYSGEQQPNIFQYFYLTRQQYEKIFNNDLLLAKEEIEDIDLIDNEFLHSYVKDIDLELDILDEVEDLIDTDDVLIGIKELLEANPENPFLLNSYYDQFLTINKQAPKEIITKLEQDFHDYLPYRFTKAYYELLKDDNKDFDEAYSLLGASISLKKGFPKRKQFSYDEWILFNIGMCLYFSFKENLHMALCYANNIELEANEFENPKALGALLILSSKMANELNNDV